MQARTIVILDPTEQPKAQEGAQAPQVKKPTGKFTVGFLWNNKPNGDVLLQNIKELLSEKIQLEKTVWQQKEVVAAPADNEIIEKLAAESNLVISAIAD